MAAQHHHVQVGCHLGSCQGLLCYDVFVCWDWHSFAFSGLHIGPLLELNAVLSIIAVRKLFSLTLLQSLDNGGFDKLLFVRKKSPGVVRLTLGGSTEKEEDSDVSSILNTAGRRGKVTKCPTAS